MWIESEEVRGHAKAVVGFEQAFEGQVGSFAQSTPLVLCGVGNSGSFGVGEREGERSGE